MENNNNSPGFESPRKSMNSPTKIMQNKSEVMNNNSQISPDKEKKPEQTKAEAVDKFLH